MRRNAYDLVSGLIFAGVAAAHALRVAFGGELVICGRRPPRWASAPVALAAAGLAWAAFRRGPSPSRAAGRMNFSPRQQPRAGAPC